MTACCPTTDTTTPCCPPARPLVDAGLQVRVEAGVACCHSVQDKIRVTDPDGTKRGIFVTTEKDFPDTGAAAWR